MASDAELQQWFSSVDTDNSGNIDAAELQTALRLGHLNFSMAMTAHMIRMFDSTRDGKVNYQEFRNLHAFLLQVQRDFKSADIYQRGSLDQQQIGQILHSKGYELDTPCLNSVFTSFNPDKSGQMKLDEYMALCFFVKSAKNTFNAFTQLTPQSPHLITLDFKQFLYAASNCR